MATASGRVLWAHTRPKSNRPLAVAIYIGESGKLLVARKIRSAGRMDNHRGHSVHQATEIDVKVFDCESREAEPWRLLPHRRALLTKPVEIPEPREKLLKSK